MKMPFAKAAILFVGVACATFLLLASFTEAQQSRVAEATSQGAIEAIEPSQGLRDEVKKAFESAEILLGRERGSIETHAQKASNPELRDSLAQWEASPAQRSATRERILANLEVSRIAGSLDFLAIVTLDNEVLLARGGTHEAPSILLRSALVLVSEPFFGEGKLLSGFETFPADSSPPATSSDKDHPEHEDQPENEMFLIAGLPLWVRADAPVAVLIGGTSFRAFSRIALGGIAAPPGKVRWHAFADEKAGPRIVAGDVVGTKVRTAFYQALVNDGSTDEPAFDGEEFAPGRWRALYGLGNQVIGGWGVTANPAGMKRVVQAAPHLHPDPWAPVVDHVTQNWVYYASGAGGLFALLLVLQIARSVRRQRAPAWPRRAPPAEQSSPIVTTPPSSSAHADSLVSQFEINWKTFASYTQDMLQQKLREMEDAPLRGVKDVREQVSKLNQALGEIKADLAAARTEVRDTTFGVAQQVANLVEHENREKKSQSDEDGAVLKKIESDFERAASRFTQLDETVGQLAGFITQKKNTEIEARVKAEVDRLEAQWNEKVAQFGSEIEEAKKQGQSLLEEMEQARKVEASLRDELKQSYLRGEELLENLNEKSREVEAIAKEREIAWRREREVQEQLIAAKMREETLVARHLELEEAIQKAKDSESVSKRREEELNREFRKATADIDRLRHELLEAQKESQETHASLTRKEREFEEDRSKLSERVKTLNTLVSQLNVQTGDVQAECDRLRGVVNAKDEQIGSLADEVTTLKDERLRLRGELTGVETELKRDKHSLANAQQALEMYKIDLEDTSLRLGTAEKEVVRLEAGLDEERAEVNRVRAEWEFRERQIMPEKEAIEKALEASLAETKRLRASEEELSKLRGQLAELESLRRSRAELNETTPRLAAFEKERKELLDSLDKVSKELERARSEAEGIRCLQGTLVDGCIPAAIVAFDAALKVFAWNLKAEGLWERSASTTIGRLLPDMGLKGLDKDLSSFAQRALREKRSVTLPQTSFTDSRGKVRHLKFSCDPIVGPRGEVLGGVLVAEEITEKVEHEIEARLQALFSQSLAKSLPGALVVIDTQSRVISWNRNAESILGVAEQEALGESFFALQTPLSKETFRRHFESVAQDKTAHRVRVRFDFGGIPTQFVVTQAPFLGNDDTVRGTILLVEEAAEAVEARK